MLNNRKQEEESAKMGWKTQSYLLGGFVGGVLGLLSAYLFAREVESTSPDGEEPPEIPAGAAMSLVLAALALVRQIAETGSKKRKK